MCPPVSQVKPIPFDINAWFAAVMCGDGLCPNCGLNFKDFVAECNVFPHFMGSCKKEVMPNERTTINPDLVGAAHPQKHAGSARTATEDLERVVCVGYGIECADDEDDPVDRGSVAWGIRTAYERGKSSSSSELSSLRAELAQLKDVCNQARRELTTEPAIEGNFWRGVVNGIWGLIAMWAIALVVATACEKAWQR